MQELGTLAADRLVTLATFRLWPLRGRRVVVHLVGWRNLQEAEEGS
jgi:hypothetical protein